MFFRITFGVFSISVVLRDTQIARCLSGLEFPVMEWSLLWTGCQKNIVILRSLNHFLFAIQFSCFKLSKSRKFKSQICLRLRSAVRQKVSGFVTHVMEWLFAFYFSYFNGNVWKISVSLYLFNISVLYTFCWSSFLFYLILHKIFAEICCCCFA